MCLCWGRQPLLWRVSVGRISDLTAAVMWQDDKVYSCEILQKINILLNLDFECVNAALLNNDLLVVYSLVEKLYLYIHHHAGKLPLLSPAPLLLASASPSSCLSKYTHTVNKCTPQKNIIQFSLKWGSYFSEKFTEGFTVCVWGLYPGCQTDSQAQCNSSPPRHLAIQTEDYEMKEQHWSCKAGWVFIHC